MPDYLTDPIHMAVVGDDLVVLDVARDAYSCLIGGARFIRLEADGQVGIEDDHLRVALHEASFLSSEPTGPRRKLPPSPSLAGPPALRIQPTFPERLRFIRTVRAMVVRYSRTGFSDLILKAETASPKRFATGSSDQAIRYASLFALWLPWVPAQGACLYRAFMLRQFLSRAGLHADWVFGVSTWPFSAHCWLQVGDVLLDDDVERVRSYTPIMVV